MGLGVGLGLGQEGELPVLDDHGRQRVLRSDQPERRCARLPLARALAAARLGLTREAQVRRRAAEAEDLEEHRTHLQWVVGVEERGSTSGVEWYYYLLLLTTTNTTCDGCTSLELSQLNSRRANWLGLGLG